MMSFADYGICMIVVNSQIDDWHPVSRYCSTNLQGFGEMVFGVVDRHFLSFLTRFKYFISWSDCAVVIVYAKRISKI
jgi:hypothetical protein